MLIAARLPKDTDVSFITEMIEVCIIISLLILREIYNIYFASNDDSYIKYYLKIVSLKIVATWKFPSVKWQGLGRLFIIADMVHTCNCIEWRILPVTSQCLFSMLLFMHFIHSLVLIGEFINSRDTMWYNSLWLWRWLPHRLSKRQSLSTTTVLFRTMFTGMIKLNLLFTSSLW